MSVSSGRVVCPRCGANNFQTQAACWKCGASLASPAAPPSAAPQSGVGTPAPPSPGSAFPSSVAPPIGADPAIANGAAIALALFFPFVAVPVGLVFLMLDDRRKIQLGKLTLVWGIVATLLQCLITWWLFREAWSQIAPLVPSLPGQSRPQTVTPSTPVPPIQFPEYRP